MLICVTVVMALVGLCGGFLLLTGSKLARWFQKYGPIFAAAILLLTAFGDIIPEVLEEGELPVWAVALLVLAGTVGCLVIGGILGHFHKHGDEHGLHNRRQAQAMFMVDSLHNIADGVVLGVAFAASLGTGLLWRWQRRRMRFHKK